VANPWPVAASKHASAKDVQVSDDQIELLRCVLARAYEKRQPLLFRLVKGIKDYIGPRTPRRPIIESLNITEKNKDAA
jgi:hypothetical protein